MTPFFIRPNGPLFFGEGTPNTAGESHLMRGLFPMPISAFQGMIRTRLLRGARPPLSEINPSDRRTRSDRQRVIEQMIGAPDSLPKGWALRGPFAAERSDADGLVRPWVAIPRFVSKDALESEKKQSRFTPASVFPSIDAAQPWLESSSASSSTRVLSGCFPQPGEAKDSNFRVGLPGKGKPAEGFVSPSGLRKLLCLNGRKSTDLDDQEFSLEPYPPFVTSRVRTGGELSYENSRQHGPNKAMADGMLYTYLEHEFADFDNRTKQSIESGWVGWVDLPGLDSRLQANVLQQGMAELGRRGRSGELSPVAKFDRDWQDLSEGHHLGDSMANEACFWLVLLSPSLTTSYDLSQVLRQRSQGLSMEILGGLLSKRRSLGGFSLASQAPRPSQPYLTPGSAWLIRISGGQNDAQRLAVLKDIHNQSIETEPEQAAFGYGHVFCSQPFALPKGATP